MYILGTLRLVTNKAEETISTEPKAAEDKNNKNLMIAIPVIIATVLVLALVSVSRDCHVTAKSTNHKAL